MPSKNLPTGLIGGESGHPDLHNDIHDIVNRFDDVVASDEDVWVYDSGTGLWVPTSLDGLYASLGHTHGSTGPQVDWDQVYVDPDNGSDANTGLTEHEPVATIDEAASRNPKAIFLAPTTHTIQSAPITFDESVGPAIIGYKPTTFWQNGTNGTAWVTSVSNAEALFKFARPLATGNMYGFHVEGVGFDATKITGDAAIYGINTNFGRVSNCRIYHSGGGANVYLVSIEADGGEAGGDDASWGWIDHCSAQRALIAKFNRIDGTINRWRITNSTMIWTHSATTTLSKPAIHVIGGPGSHQIWGISMEQSPTSGGSSVTTAPAIKIERNGGAEGNGSVSGHNSPDSCWIGGLGGEAITGPGNSYVDVDARGCMVFYQKDSFAHKGTIREWNGSSWAEVPELVAPGSGFTDRGFQVSSRSNAYAITPRFAD